MKRGGTAGRVIGPQQPQPFIFQFEPENEEFKFRIQFKKSHVSRDELITDAAWDSVAAGGGFIV